MYLLKEVRYHFKQAVCKICSIVLQAIMETDSSFQFFYHIDKISIWFINIIN